MNLLPNCTEYIDRSNFGTTLEKTVRRQKDIDLMVETHLQS